MTDENGKQPIKNRTLREAYSAVVTVMRVSKLPIHSVKSRLALNRNSLRPLVAALEESQGELLEAAGCRMTESGGLVVVDEEVRGVTARLQRLGETQDALKVLAEGETEWAPVARIELRKFPDEAEVDGNDLAALMEAGIVVGEPPAETPPDAKRKVD
jgi:hypothetical protein